jgi:excisionase family DNA binding protein
MGKEKMLSTNEVAQQMGVAYTTVMLWIKQGKLEAVKRVHPRGDYYEIPASALKKLDRGQKGRPRKETPESNADDGNQASQAALANGAGDQEPAAADVAAEPTTKPKRKASKRSPAKKALKKAAKKAKGN